MRVRSTRARGGGRGFGCAAALLSGIAVLLVVTLAAAGIFLLASGNKNVAASFIRAQPGSIPWNSQDRLNVLVLGVKGAGTRPAPTSSIMVASYEPHSGHLTLLSIPGNLWVNIPGYGPGQISTAYQDGGARLAQLTVQAVLRMPIPYRAVLGNTGFKQVVDGLGGVTISVPAGLAPQLKSGTQHLDGAAALTYVAARAAGDRDQSGQMGRQQQLLLALMKQGLAPDALFRIPSLISALGSSVSTNFPLDQVPNMAQRLSGIPSDHIRLAELNTVGGLVTEYDASGTHVLLPHWQSISRLSHALLGNPLQIPGMRVEVLNGSDISGQAATLTQWLQQTGIAVQGYDSAPSSAYAHSQVQISRTALPAQRRAARVVAELLQVPLVSLQAPPRPGRITIMIGRDYQDLAQQ